MATLNIPASIEAINAKLFNSNINPKQNSGLSAILTEWMRTYSTLPMEFLAYMLATTYHETAKTMQPIKEYGSGKGKAYGISDPVTKQAYYGRGFVQLTWKENYSRFSKLLNIDLVNNPDLALDTDCASQVMFIGMTKGLFTGKKLSDYITEGKADYTNARRIINGTDCADKIAGYAVSFYSCLKTQENV